MSEPGIRIRRRRQASQLQALRKLQRRLEPLMVLLGVVWLVLLVMELLNGLPRLLDVVSIVIWAIFIFEFIVLLVLAPDRTHFLKTNWLMAITLIVPAFRLLLILRVLRLARLLRLAGITAALNRARRALHKRMATRRLAYVSLMTTLVAFTGAAGMYAFERQVNPGFDTYGDSLWWTAMILTTLGSQYWPVTWEGRALGLLLSVYTFGVFGYFTAVLASFFIGKDRPTAA